MVSERTAISCPPGIRGLTGAPGDQYYDRGDPAAADFTQAVLTMNNLWQDLDLSAIIGVGVKLVRLVGKASDNTVGATFQFRENGNVNGNNVSIIIAQVANIAVPLEIQVLCDAGGIIEYKASEAWTMVFITVAGWWA